MKTAIYIEDGIVQLVITPETDFEKNALASMKGDVKAEIFRGEFYDCRGGWTRQKRIVSSPYDSEERDNSLIIRTKAEVEL